MIFWGNKISTLLECCKERIRIVILSHSAKALSFWQCLAIVIVCVIRPLVYVHSSHHKDLYVSLY